jgi:hypothetical protein
VKLINTDGLAFIGPGSEWFWTVAHVFCSVSDPTNDPKWHTTFVETVPVPRPDREGVHEGNAGPAAPGHHRLIVWITGLTRRSAGRIYAATGGRH